MPFLLLSVSLVFRCCVGVLHSYSPLSVSTVLTISRVPNSVSLNLRLLPNQIEINRLVRINKISVDFFGGRGVGGWDGGGGEEGRRVRTFHFPYHNTRFVAAPDPFVSLWGTFSPGSHPFLLSVFSHPLFYHTPVPSNPGFLTPRFPQTSVPSRSRFPHTLVPLNPSSVTPWFR